MQRRKFVGSALGTLAGASIAPAFSRSANEATVAAPLHKKSLKFGMIKEDISLVEKFKLVKSLGFDGVELDYPNELDENEILEAKEEAGIEIPGTVNSLHWKKPISDSSASVRSECTDSMIEALHKTKLYGGTTVLLVPGVVSDDVTYEQAWDRSVTQIHRMLPAAQETGVKIAFENVWNNFLISPMEAARYVDQFNSNMVGWYFDVGNIVRYGWPHHWVSALAHRIIKIDIKDYSRTKQKEEGIWEGFKVKLGDGDADWPKVNQALAEVGYNGWGSAEVSGGDRTRLQEISERMDRLYSM